MMENEHVVESPVLSVTPLAAGKIKQLLAERNIPDFALRVFVAGGGCSGLQYGMTFESEFQDTDTVVEVDGVRLVVDEGSLRFISGASIDFVDNLVGGGFRIENPNALSTCGCGTSFRTAEHESQQQGGGCGGCG